MTATPHRVLTSRLDTLKKAEANGEVSAEDADAIRSFINAYRPGYLMETPPADDETFRVGTCSTYLARLTETARRITLTEATAADVNGVLQSLMDDGKAEWTVHGFSTAIRKFYGFVDFGPSPDNITRIDTPDGSSFDPDDCLTRDEIHELLNASDNPRDRAVVALLVYTGMRNAALRHLRVGDVDEQDGKWKVNDEVEEGMKGLGTYGQKRPLLGAAGPVRDWLRYHPASDDPDAYLITGRPKYGKADPSSPVAGSTTRRVMKRVVENTGNPEIQRKPTHPHMMRHNFVTICKRDYDMDDAVVKRLIGHSPSSKVMETTYSHLSDEDYIERAEVAAGIRDPSENESALTPPICSTCDEPLPQDAKACPNCGALFTPDARAAETTIDAMKDDVTDGIKAADDADERAAKVEALRALDDDIKAELVDVLGVRLGE
jgi:integrase